MRELILQPKNGQELLELMLKDLDISFDLPCGGNHTCGKCKIKVSGQLDQMSKAEEALLTADDIANGIRLACFAHALGEVSVYLPKYPSVRILTDSRGSLLTDGPLMDDSKLGAAVDIGTTTVVCKLYDQAGRELAVCSAMNSQSIYGADVISRIHQGMQYGHQPIHQAIVKQVQDMLTKLAKQSGGSLADISHAVVVGNTTMLHFFAGLDPKGIGAAPFTPASLFGEEYTAIIPGLTCYLPLCISAYVGADLIACLLATEFIDLQKTALLVDIGTNGEMALIHQGKLFCCSTAAGPAFEGAGISCGMTAAQGAIVHVEYDQKTEKFDYDTLDDVPAIGICGSGIIDISAALLKSEAMLPSGALEASGHPLAALMGENKELIFPNSKIYFNQKDIRQVQLAKAAIYGGMVTLAENCNIEMDDVQMLFLCGGFGSFLNLDAAETIGLIPKNSSSYAVNMGNAALKGAAMLLLNKNVRDHVSNLADQCEYIELSGDQQFMDNYIDAMTF